MARPVIIGGDICARCARNRGGEWPLDTLASPEWAECQMCGEETWVVHWTDWHWPRNYGLSGSASFWRRKVARDAWLRRLENRGEAFQ